MASHFSMPFDVDPLTGHVREAEQDSVEDVAGCVEVILRTPRGFRDELPEFGLPDPAFKPQEVTIEAMRVAVTEWEPRAVATFEDQSNAFELGVQRIRATIDRGGSR